jgi:sulfate adenylyltransferase
MKSWAMTARQICDIELLLTGAFSPLTNFMSEADYRNVVENMRLSNGQFWPMPIVLAVTGTFADTINLSEYIALRDAEGVLLATLRVDKCWIPDKAQEARCIYGTEKTNHPGVESLFRSGDVYISGQLQAVELPAHHAYLRYRQTPAQLQVQLHANGRRQVIALQSQHAIHRATWEAACQYAQQHNAGLLIQCIVDLTQPEDKIPFIRIRCHEYIISQSPTTVAQLNLLNLATRNAGLRELLWQALVLHNYGATHFMVSPEQASVLKAYESQLGICILTTPTVKAHTKLLALSDAELSHYLLADLPIPEEFSFPEVLSELRRSYPSRRQQGFAVFFTGLSGSGKSTVANALLVKLMEITGRSITLLDGDVVRKHLSSELNFSKEHRDINIRRIGFVASEIVKNGGIAICAPIAPYSQIRQEVRNMVSSKGGFIEVHVSTPLSECEKRDRKGLYTKARAGILKGFTGIDDPYEIPETPELRLDTSEITPVECVIQVLNTLENLGYLKH